jgi:hypothetical protein
LGIALPACEIVLYTKHLFLVANQGGARGQFRLDSRQSREADLFDCSVVGAVLLKVVRSAIR